MYLYFDNRERASTVVSLAHGMPQDKYICVTNSGETGFAKFEALQVKWGPASFKDDWMDHN